MANAVPWTVAIRDATHGATIDLEVVPGAKASLFPAGFNAWRRRLSARLREPPEDGRANEELVGLVAAALGVPPASVRIVAGATQRLKSVAVAGLAAADVARRLEGRV